jgi:hypothetical protein
MNNILTALSEKCRIKMSELKKRKVWFREISAKNVFEEKICGNIILLH